MADAKKIAVVGGGAWGTALACVALKAGSDVKLWARNPIVVDDINEGRGNPLYLPNVVVDERVKATTDMEEALSDTEIVLLVVPSQQMRQVAEVMQPYTAGKTVVICCKGIERGTGALMHDVAGDVLPDSEIAILSGPTFAKEVAAGLPTAVTVASRSSAAREQIREALGTPTFRIYLTDDMVGAEIGGAVKNVLAIACGIVSGRKFGENAQAALVTRGLTEVTRLGETLGARTETMMSLCGMGDLTLTCNSPQSRNMSFGLALGQGRSVADILTERRAVTEGVWSAGSVTELADKLGVDMPICQAVQKIVAHDADIDETIHALLNRPFLDYE